MTRWLGPAVARIRARRARTLLAAAGIVAAAIMVGTAVTIAFGLSTGFERAADRADLPDLIARFDAEDRSDVAARVDRLANVAAVSYRREVLDFAFSAGDHFTDRTAIQVVGNGRRGYEIVDGRDLTGAQGEIVVERGLASDWGLAVGDRIGVQNLGSVEIAGISVSPDDVAFPLNSRPRAYLSQAWVRSLEPDPQHVNMALLWANDPSQLDPLLVQARSVGFGLSDLRFATRDGIQALIDRAAGIIIALLGAFSLVAVAAAGVMLGATARADVERRLQTIGIMRAVGVSRLGIVGRYGVDATLVALPAAVIGLAIGALAAAGASASLLEILNEAPPGRALLLPLAACLVGLVALVAAATLWPAWRAAGRRPAETLRGAEVRTAARHSRASGGPFGLGVRLAAGRRVRTLATAAVVAAATGVVLLLLASASFLTGLENDPGTLDRHYELTANLPATEAARVAALPGVADAAGRYEVDASSSFELGQPVKVIGIDGAHAGFEQPALAAGRRVQADDEAEVGVGLADALGLEPGATLALQLPSGREARFRVVGTVRAIDSEGRVAYVRPRRLLAADPSAESTVAVKLDDGADAGAVSGEIRAIGGEPESAGGSTTTDNQAFLGVLAGVLRVVAVVNLLICLYALVQALAVTAAERRRTIAILRASGASRRTLTLLMLGTAAAVVAVAVPVGLLLERLLLGPVVADLAAGYADLPLGASAVQIAVTVAGLAAVAVLAAAWVARRAESEPIAAALRGE